MPPWKITLSTRVQHLYFLYLTDSTHFQSYLGRQHFLPSLSVWFLYTCNRITFFCHILPSTLGSANVLNDFVNTYVFPSVLLGCSKGFGMHSVVMHYYSITEWFHHPKKFSVLHQFNTPFSQSLVTTDQQREESCSLYSFAFSRIW